jgi:hypothetical protein
MVRLNEAPSGCSGFDELSEKRMMHTSRHIEEDEDKKDEDEGAIMRKWERWESRVWLMDTEGRAVSLHCAMVVVVVVMDDDDQKLERSQCRCDNSVTNREGRRGERKANRSNQRSK